MKIGIYDPYLDTLGGGERYMLHSAFELAKDHDVSIFWDDKDILTKAKNRFGKKLDQIHVVPNIFIKTPLIERLLTTRQYDCIFFLSDGSIPLVLTKLYLHFQFPVQWVNGRAPMTMLKLQRVKAIVCNSAYTKKYIDKTFNITSSVVYPPVTMYETKTPKKNSIISVGRFQQLNNTFVKKQDVLINIFKKLVNNGLKNWELILLGGCLEADVSLITELQNATENYPITIVPNASLELLTQAYNTGKIYWHAAGFGEDIVLHPERVEHFGITTVEAMSAGCVPIVFNAGGQKEIITPGTNGYLWETESELENQTIRIIEDQKKYSQLSQAAIHQAHQFDESNFAHTLKQIIL